MTQQNDWHRPQSKTKTKTETYFLEEKRGSGDHRNANSTDANNSFCVWAVSQKILTVSFFCCFGFGSSGSAAERRRTGKGKEKERKNMNFIVIFLCLRLL